MQKEGWFTAHAPIEAFLTMVEVWLDTCTSVKHLICKITFHLSQFPVAIPMNSLLMKRKRC